MHAIGHVIYIPVDWHPNPRMRVLCCSEFIEILPSARFGVLYLILYDFSNNYRPNEVLSLTANPSWPWNCLLLHLDHYALDGPGILPSEIEVRYTNIQQLLLDRALHRPYDLIFQSNIQGSDTLINWDPFGTVMLDWDWVWATMKEIPSICNWIFILDSSF